MVGGRLCVSCYNRMRELRAGRNSKGNPPIRVAARLHDVALVVTTAEVVHRVTAAGVAGPVEVMLARAREARAPISFGWSGR
jgi:uncharacterized Fe-S cluster-containing radical SAM superfamily protein